MDFKILIPMLLMLCFLAVIAKAEEVQDDIEEEEKTYVNHKVIQVYVSGKDEQAALLELQNNSTVDLWGDPVLDQNITFRVASENSEEVEGELEKNGIDFNILTDNLQSWIEQEKEDNKPGLFLEERDVNNFSLDKYHPFEEISGYVDLLAQKYSNIARLNTIGTTSQGRPIKGLRISSGGANKPIVWIDSGIHAREWVAPASGLYIITKLLKGYGTDNQVNQLLNTYDFHIYPVINPDGYKHTWTTDRLWRKNRNQVQGQYRCVGTDPNRNFDTLFGGQGTSSNPCSEIYRGPYAFSEAESRAIRDGIKALGSRVKFYITIHSYSMLLMIPYGNGRATYTKDYHDQIAAAQAGAAAIQAKSGQSYRTGTIAQLLFPAAGSSVDWAYEAANIKYSVAVELRDRGHHGFVLPAEQIVPTAEEIYDGIQAMVKYAQKDLHRG